MSSIQDLSLISVPVAVSGLENDTAESLDFEILSHSPSSTAENIVELLHSLADEHVRQEITNNVQLIIDDNKTLKESLIETNKEMAEQYEKLKTWAVENEMEDKVKEAKQKEFENELECLKERHAELQAELNNKNDQVTHLTDALDKMTKVKSHVEKEKVELLAINLELQQAQDFTSIDAKAADYAVVERCGSNENDVNTNSLEFSRQQPVAEQSMSTQTTPNTCIQETQTDPRTEDAMAELRIEVLKLTNELKGKSEELQQQQIKCAKSENEVETLKIDFETLNQRTQTNKIDADEREHALNQEIIQLQTKCVELEELQRELVSHQQASRDVAADESSVKEDFLTGVLLQREEELKLKEKQVEKLQKDVKKVQSDVSKIVAARNDDAEHWKKQANVFQDELVKASREIEDFKKKLHDEEARRIRYFSAYQRVEQRLRASGANITDSEIVLPLMPTTEEEFPPRGGIDEVDDTSLATITGQATNAANEQDIEVPEFACPLCQRKHQTIESLERHVHECLDENERIALEQRREERVEV